MSGIPYMGSKRAIARDLVTTILNRHPDATHVYDLFGGGGAMSLEFARRGLHVTYNDKDRAIASLFRHLVTGGDLGEWATRWVSRDDFHELRKREDWIGGFVRSVWSFGNNHEKGYLYGPDIETYKRAIHDAICHPDRVEGDEVHGVPLAAMEGCWSIDERRLAYVRAWRDVHDKKKDLMGGGSTSRHRAPRAHQPDPKNRGGQLEPRPIHAERISRMPTIWDALSASAACGSRALHQKNRGGAARRRRGGRLTGRL